MTFSIGPETTSPFTNSPFPQQGSGNSFTLEVLGVISAGQRSWRLKRECFGGKHGG